MARTHSTAANARYVADLTPKMGEGLERCHTMVVLTSQPHVNPTVHANTLRALVKHELIEKRRDNKMRWIFRPTANGLRVLLADQPRLLKHRHGYTTEPAFSMRDEPEAVDVVWLGKFADEAAEADRRRQVERPVAWRLQQALKDAEALGLDVTRERLAIERRIVAITRKTQQRAA